MIMLGRLILSYLSLSVTAFLVPGIHIENFVSAAVAALVICIINIFLKPILQLLSLPITILSLGLFYFIINGFLLMLASWIVPGFSIDNYGWALIASLCFSLVMTFFLMMFGKDDHSKTS
jgi:putative membrane protein